MKKYTTEIRFVPDPIILDKRGDIVKHLLSRNFKDWAIDTNRVQITNKDGFIFVSYNNLGFITSNEDKLDEFVDSFDEALKFLGDLPPIRWGFRIMAIEQSDGGYPKLLKTYQSKLLNYQSDKFSKIGGELSDIGVSYIFKEERFTYHLSSGPMKKDQAKDLFPNAKIPANSIFVDLDIYREKEQFYRDDFRRSRIKDFINFAKGKGEEIIKEFMENLNEK